MSTRKKSGARLRSRALARSDEAGRVHGPLMRSAEAQSVIARLEAENRTLHEARALEQMRYEQLHATRDGNRERAAAAEGALAELRAVVRELRMDILYARIGVHGRRDMVPGAGGEPTPVRKGEVRAMGGHNRKPPARRTR